jgi:hypothetical protein
MSIDDDDHVGYGHPPKRSRYKPGQSGNLKGRPPKEKKSVTVETQRKILKALRRKVKDAHGNPTTTTFLEAGFLNCLQVAAKNGDTKAMLALYHLGLACEEGTGEKPPTVFRIIGGFGDPPLRK